MNLTESQVADLIIRPDWAQKFMLPNYTPMNWWECDVFELSKSGYFTEYEVKLTLGDFKADAGKEKRGRGSWDADWKWEEAPAENKHQLLANKDPRGPVRFFYVTPSRLITRDILPPWAGLIEVCKNEPPSSREYYLRTVVEPPRLHKSKIDPKVEAHAKSVCYYRMHRLLGKLRKTMNSEELKELAA